MAASRIRYTRYTRFTRIRYVTGLPAAGSVSVKIAESPHAWVRTHHSLMRPLRSYRLRKTPGRWYTLLLQ